MSSKNLLTTKSPNTGLSLGGMDLFKNAFKAKLANDKGIAAFIDDKSSIYEADYKNNLKIENQLNRKLKFMLPEDLDKCGSHSSDNSQIHKTKKSKFKKELDVYSDVHFSEDDELDKKFLTKFVGREISKVMRKIQGCYDTIDDLK